MNTPIALLLSVAFALAPLFAQQPSTQQPVQLPELPKREVPLVTPPPPQITPQPRRSVRGAVFPDASHVFVNGTLYLKLGNVFVPGPGSCCFCPDGVERKPLTQLEVEQLKQSSAKTNDR